LTNSDCCCTLYDAFGSLNSLQNLLPFLVDIKCSIVYGQDQVYDVCQIIFMLYHNSQMHSINDIRNVKRNTLFWCKLCHVLFSQNCRFLYFGKRNLWSYWIGFLLTVWMSYNEASDIFWSCNLLVTRCFL